jgi:pantoate--beta-alanine ligase
MSVQIVGAPTVREADGLAMSSRNQYPTSEQRSIAPRIYEILTATAKRLQAGDSEFASMERGGCQMLEAAGLKPDYFAVRQASDLSAARADTGHLVVLTAVRLGKARLIDNVQVKR